MPKKQVTPDSVKYHTYVLTDLEGVEWIPRNLKPGGVIDLPEGWRIHAECERGRKHLKLRGIFRM